MTAKWVTFLPMADVLVEPIKIYIINSLKALGSIQREAETGKELKLERERRWKGRQTREKELSTFFHFNSFVRKQRAQSVLREVTEI